MEPLNLDAAKAARREAMEQTPAVIFGGREFALPVELPFAVVEDIRDLKGAEGADDPAAQAGILASVMRHLLGDEYEAFMALAPSLDDFAALVDGILTLYGTDVGNSSASES